MMCAMLDEDRFEKGDHMRPLISVILPFYRRADWLEAAVESVYRQDMQDFEIVLVDDGSAERVDELLGRFDARLRYLAQENRGPAAARNAGIRNASGAYIAFLDSDDIWADGKLSRQIAFMEQGGWQWSHTGYRCFHEDGTPGGRVDVSGTRGEIFPPAYLMFRLANGLGGGNQPPANALT